MSSDVDESSENELYDLSFSLSSPGSLNFTLKFLKQLTNQDVIHASVELKSPTPFDAEPSFESTTQEKTPQTHYDALSETATESVAQSDTTQSQPQAPVEADSTPETTAEPDTARDSSEPEEETEEDEETTCEYCKEKFDSPTALSGHLRWCSEYPDNTASETQSDTQEDSQPSIPDEFNLTTGTEQFRILSTLLHADGSPHTSADLAEILTDTSWESTKSRLSTTLGKLHSNGSLEREERENSKPGANPYEYTLTDNGRRLIEDTEETAQEEGTPTFEDIQKQDTEGEPSDSDEDDDLRCDICNDTFKTSQGLGSHMSIKHGKGADDSTESVQEMPLNIGTRRYKVASLLSVTENPVTAKELANLIEETEWELSQSNISADLGDLHDWGAVTREKRTSATGHPYEYTLTEDGRDRIEDTIETAEETGEETVYDIINESDADEPAGLDVLFTDEEADGDLNHFEDVDDVDTEAADDTSQSAQSQSE